MENICASIVCKKTNLFLQKTAWISMYQAQQGGSHRSHMATAERAHATKSFPEASESPALQSLHFNKEI